MKKRVILILALISLSVSQISAQDEFKKEWNIGVGFGATMSSVDFEPSVAVNNLQQYMGGISVRYLSEKNLGLIAEINYSQQGWEGKFQDNPDYEHSHKLNYIEMPILTHIYFGNKVRFYLNIGPKFSYLMSESESMNDAFRDYLASGDLEANIPTDQYYRKAQKSIDYGIVAGVGMEFRTGVGSFSLEGRYNFGLGDVYKNSKADYFSRSANRVIGVKLTYYVKLF